jgi:hypothetical protein
MGVDPILADPLNLYLIMLSWLLCAKHRACPRIVFSYSLQMK